MMKRLHCWYRPEQTIENGRMTSNRKPGQVVCSAMNELNDNIEIHGDFASVTTEQLKRVHSANYVDDVVNLRKPNGFGNRDATDLEQALAHCGSFLAAAEGALKYGVSFSPSQGFHHAGHNYGGCYCTFNGLMVAADALAQCGLNVVIFDGDAHYGDGTEDILEKLPTLRNRVKNIPFSCVANSMENADDSVGLQRGIDKVFGKSSNANIIFYQAGADAHIDDPYGCGYMSTHTFNVRDQLIFNRAQELQIPIVFNLAGGYQPDDAVIGLHLGTIKTAISSASDNQHSHH